MNNYKITKAIRFKLEAEDETILEIQKDVEALNQKFNLSFFVSGLNNFIADVNQFLFYQKEDKSFFVKDKMIIKTEWLRQYAKQELVDFQKKQENTQKGNKRRVQKTISDFPGLATNIKDRFIEIKNIYKNLADAAASTEQNERAKRKQIGLLLKQLKTKNALPYFFSLIENTADKNETNDLSLRLKSQSTKLEQQLTAGLQAYLPSQSDGLPVAKASFNYYTINKKPVDFTEKQRKLEDDLLKVQPKDIFLTKYNFSNELKQAIIADIQKELGNNKTLLLGDAPMLSVENYASLRHILKKIKSIQMKAFSEMIKNNLKNSPLYLFNKMIKKTYSDLENSPLYLFNKITQDQFNDYLNKTKELEELNKIKQSTNDIEKKNWRSLNKKIAKERGNMIKDQFEYWKKFADIYRTVAQKHGRILAQLKGIEKERIESQLLKYWALILENNGQHKLILIPREKAAACKQWITSAKPATQNQPKIFWFESLTYRSLQKLCFGFAENGNNEFNKNIQHLLPKDDKGKIKNGEFAFEGDEQKKIEFYKKVLSSNYTQQVLNLPFQQIKQEIVEKKFETLDEFQIALEKICYRRYAVLAQNAETDLAKTYNAQIFNITAIDLKKTNASANLNRHTKIWKDFWTAENEQKHFETRLNPEITITYRQPKQSRIDKYGINSTKNNRYLHPQFTLITTMSQHSNAPTKVLSFMSDEDFKKSVDKFNKKISEENITFALGIDNGETELSTLGVYLPVFDKGTYKDKITEYKDKITELRKVSEYGFKVLTIKNLNYKETDYQGKERKMIQNPSYFLKKENYMRTFNKTEQEYEAMFAAQFEEKNLLTLDLSTAKVICGRIVTNGDVPALFNLWLKHAQRNVFAMNDHIKKETAKKIHIKNKLDTDLEKLKFAEYISKEKEFKKLNDDEKQKYVKWILEDRDQYNYTDKEKRKFSNTQEKKGKYNKDIIFASCFVGDELHSVIDIFDVRHIFKKREEFYALKTEAEIMQLIDSYNTNRTSHDISNEELDLKITEAKKALVANAIGVIDFLYHQYKNRFGGEGLIIKEGFDTKKVEKDLEKFSGNIYRILERKLYQKFQNDGLVPPIKSLMAVRENENEDKDKDEKKNKAVRAEGIKNKNAILQLGIVGFINPDDTSQVCPVCNEKITRNHANEIVCETCSFESKNIMHSNDGIAGFNIAKRGFNNFKNGIYITLT